MCIRDRGNGYVERDVIVWFALVNINLAPQAMEQKLPITRRSLLIG